MIIYIIAPQHFSCLRRRRRREEEGLHDAM